MLQIDPSERASIPEIFNHSWIRSMSNSSFHYSEVLSLKPSVPRATGALPAAAPASESASPKISKPGQKIFWTPKGDSKAEGEDNSNSNSEGIASEAFRSPVISPKVLTSLHLGLNILLFLLLFPVVAGLLLMLFFFYSYALLNSRVIDLEAPELSPRHLTHRVRTAGRSTYHKSRRRLRSYH